MKRAWGTGAEANVLTIEGEIVNISDAPSDVPGLRVLFLNNAGDVIELKKIIQQLRARDDRDKFHFSKLTRFVAKKIKLHG